MNAVITTKVKPSFRIMPSSLQVRRAIAAALGAFALAAAFPKLNAAWLVPFGAAALFWSWQGASWGRAALLGLLAGLIFFSLDYSWVGFTVSHYVGAFGPIVPIGPAIVEAPYFAAAGALSAAAYARARPALAPLAAAAAFTLCEWARSVGVLGAPFDQLGYTEADGPLRAIAAFAGTYGITFALCVLGAYLADALVRRSWRTCGIAWGGVAVVALAAWIAWPARSLPPPTIRVAAVQGNIPQSLKWNKDALGLAVRRYTTLTREAIRAHARLIVWPETVMTTILNLDPPLVATIGDLAHEGNVTIVAGAQEYAGKKFYDSLYIFAPSGSYVPYRKRQLVPFAERFPGEKFLWWLPYVGSLNSRIDPASIDGVYPTTALRIAPLICWESAFADLAHAQMRNGAQLLVISTDDAWFGETSGPYMHAQISQLRAIETGAYVVRAAATGISGIIAPDGHWTSRTHIDTLKVAFGKVGPPVGTLFALIGPTPVVVLLAALYVALLLLPPARKGRHEAQDGV
jgi:apolipoprotein N-acyltransferase